MNASLLPSLVREGVASKPPPTILQFPDSRRKQRQYTDLNAQYLRHLGRNGFEVLRQEEMLKDARAWAEAELGESVSRAEDREELKRRVVKRTWEPMELSIVSTETD